MTIGDNIKRFRKENKLTQKQLGEKIGKSTISIRKYEADDITPSISVLESIANTLGVYVSALLGTDDATSYVINEMVKNKTLTDNALNMMVQSQELLEMKNTFRKLGYKIDLTPIPFLYIIDMECDKVVAKVTKNDLKTLNNMLNRTSKGIIEGFIDTFKVNDGDNYGE